MEVIQFIRQQGSHLKALILLIALVAILIGASSPLAAQGGLQSLGNYTFSPVNARWSADSMSFIFQPDDYGVNATWYQYNVATHQMTSTNVWPLQPIVTSAQEQSLEIAREADGQVSFVFASPNGRYWVYASTHRTGYRYQLATADLQANTHKILP